MRLAIWAVLAALAAPSWAVADPVVHDPDEARVLAYTRTLKNLDGWTFAGHDSDGVFYVMTPGKEAPADFVGRYLRGEYFEAHTASSARSSLSLISVDCAEWTFRLEVNLSYSRPNLAGRKHDDGAGEWQDVVPGSVMEDLAKDACQTDAKAPRGGQR